VDVFGGEIRTRAQSCADSKEVDCQLWKGLCLREVAKTRQRGVNLSSAFRHKWRKDEVPVAENTLTDAVERADAG
jgi:hypothetical protein